MDLQERVTDRKYPAQVPSKKQEKAAEMAYLQKVLEDNDREVAARKFCEATGKTLRTFQRRRRELDAEKGRWDKI
jgi:hypothetical protein